MENMRARVAAFAMADVRAKGNPEYNLHNRICSKSKSKNGVVITTPSQFKGGPITPMAASGKREEAAIYMTRTTTLQIVQPHVDRT